ncbi:MAG: SDR family oxidoreductase [Actinobacteria bacterium]|nr:SDR family oxidoreductase [Actinomycetota bacterium]
MRLENKISIVTGSAKGIGRAIAIGFAREGAKACIADIDESNGLSALSEVQLYSPGSFFIRTDISDLNQIASCVKETMNRFGRIDILVNNAGIGKFVPFLEVTPELVDKIWSVNLRGTFFMMQAVAKFMVQQKYGKIINMSSLSEEVGTPLLSHYSTTKGGIKIMTKCVALELASYNINVNTIGPGIIDTDISKDFFSIPENRADALRKIPLGRMGNPEDIVGAAIFLASDESQYVTGTTIFVDGGLTAW